MNNSLNSRTAGVVDAILSNYARAYRNADMIGTALFPIAPVPQRNMRLIKFGKESFRLLNTKRAPGAATKRVQYGFASDPISLLQDSLEALVPFEHQQEAAGAPNIDLASNAVKMVMDVIELGHEFESANLARNVANYHADNQLVLAADTDKWDHPESDPAQDISDAREQIRRKTGRYPNTLALGPDVFNALTRHAKIKDQFKYTSSESITEVMLAKYFKLKKVVVGSAVYLPEDAPEDALANDVWGKDAILAFVPDGTTGNFQVPSFGYQYELSGYPQVEQPYPERNAKSWVYPTTSERRPYLTGADAGFIFKNAVK